MLEAIQLPVGLDHVRTTPRFDASSVPAGLLRAHQVASGVWGVLHVLEGRVVFVLEHSGERRELGAGERQVIEPEVLHHVEPGEGAVFEVEFHR